MKPLESPIQSMAMYIPYPILSYPILSYPYPYPYPSLPFSILVSFQTVHCTVYLCYSYIQS